MTWRKQPLQSKAYYDRLSYKKSNAHQIRLIPLCQSLSIPVGTTMLRSHHSSATENSQSIRDASSSSSTNFFLDESKRKSRMCPSYFRRGIHDFQQWPTSKKVVMILGAVLVLWSIVWRIGRYNHRHQERPPPEQRLDFLIAGFPKTGTTSLLETLRLHPEVAMGPREDCLLAKPIQADDVNLKRLNRYLTDIQRDVLHERKSTRQLTNSHNKHDILGKPTDSSRSSLQLGVKCPDALKNFKAIHRLTQHSPHCKIVIGLRHPVWYIQSFYNYRIFESVLKHRPDVPTLREIWDTRSDWWDVSPDATRYELFLSQFGKTTMSTQQLKEWLADRPMLAVKPNRFPIFIYAIEQLHDPEQSSRLRHDLQSFLGLREPIAPFGHENNIAVKAPTRIDKQVDICALEYDDIRKDILQHAESTISWMNEFLASPDVKVSDEPTLRKLIDNWKEDPCKGTSL